MHVELGEMVHPKEQARYQERNRLHRATRNGTWISAVPHRLNSTELSWGGFLDNLCLRYGLMLQDIPATYDVCGKKLSIDHALSCVKGGLVLSRHDNAEKEWGALRSWALVPSA